MGVTVSASMEPTVTPGTETNGDFREEQAELLSRKKDLIHLWLAVRHYMMRASVSDRHERLAGGVRKHRALCLCSIIMPLVGPPFDSGGGGWGLDYVYRHCLPP